MRRIALCPALFVSSLLILALLFFIPAINAEAFTEPESRAQEAQLSLLRREAATQVEQALIRLAQQRATVECYRSGIVPLTLDLLRKTQIGYASGASTYLEVLEAQRTLRQVQTEYLQALVGVRANEAALESALGATLPPSVAGIVNPSGAATLPGVAAPGTIAENATPGVESSSREN